MEQTCPRCRTSTFQNPHLKLMVNVCGHRLCTNCIEAVFTHPTSNCLDCGKLLRRSEFRAQLFEDASVEREVDIRKRILRDYNKRQEDFKTLREYNDYLEEIEEIIFNLASGTDIEQTQERVEKYRAANQMQIVKSRSMQARHIQSMEQELAAVLEVDEMQQQMQRAEAERLAELRKKARMDVIDLLATTSRPGEAVRQHLQKLDDLSRPTEIAAPPAPKTLGTGHETFIPTIPMDEGHAYVYVPESIDTDGPPLLSLDEITQRGYSQHWRSLTPTEAAGGFTMDHACSRVLLDAFSGLFCPA
ncbi:CDK-activating kinase assembly factor MAT1-like [Sycon ciliatum]|uniref:CDK-activating kinase assembly factor MAT1-like n=1 Tax=Sycon ciliatum TaxID=27933 RepID=UPI0020AEE8C3|eukprot:scpid95173/ scgid6687/ CDK-activating kinase assembly factor MAT1; CDK7/cyclin-H assembly factor; Menage a trois; RING finger protein MAT1